MLGAIADETRFDIVNRLVKARSLKSSEIARAYDMSVPAVSKHLKVLREVGLVTVTRKGRNKIYSPDPKALATLQHFVHDSELFWKKNLDSLARYIESKKD